MRLVRDHQLDQVDAIVDGETMVRYVTSLCDHERQTQQGIENILQYDESDHGDVSEWEGVVIPRFLYEETLHKLAEARKVIDGVADAYIKMKSIEDCVVMSEALKMGSQEDFDAVIARGMK